MSNTPQMNERPSLRERVALRHGLAILVLVLSIPTMSFAGNGEKIAQVGDDVYYEKKFLKKSVKNKYRLEWAVNGFRPVAEGRLLQFLAPKCAIEASDEDIKSYAAWAERGLKSVYDALGNPTDGNSAEFSQSNKIGEALSAIYTHDPKFIAHAQREIAQWRRYNCIQNFYGGDRFFVPDGSFDRYVREEMKKNQMMLMNRGGVLLPPYVRTPEPVTAIGRMMKVAEGEGLLKFFDKKRPAYFFSRYEGPKFANRTAEEALHKLIKPYWME